MKKLKKEFFYFLLLVILSFAPELYSQCWIRTYDNNGNSDICSKIIETSNHNYIVCGSSTPSGDWQWMWGWDGYIFSINNNGDTLWTKVTGSSSNDFLGDVIDIGNNEYLFTGIRYRYLFPNDYKHQLWLIKMKLNETGTQIVSMSEKYYGEPNKNEGGAKIIKNPDGTFMVIGFTESYGTQIGGHDAWLLKLNSNLDTIWTKTYDYGYAEEGTAIVPFQDNKYLISIKSVTGQITPFPGYSFYTSFAKILLIDSLGNILKTLTIDDDTINAFGNIYTTNDGGAILIGSSSINDNGLLGGRDIFIVKLNQIADIEWTKIYGNYGKYDGGIDIIQHTNGNYYVICYSQSKYTDSVDNWWLLKLNPEGDTLYTKWLIHRPFNDDPASILFTSDGFLMVAGWIDASSYIFNGPTIGNSNVCIVKMDTTFSLTAIQNISEENWINCFLSGNVLYFKMIKEYNSVEIDIYSVCGKILKNIKFSNEKFISININDIPAGFYLVKVTADNNKKIFKVLK